MDYWVLLLNDGISEMRSAFSKASSRASDADAKTQSRQLDIVRINKEAAEGRVLPSEDFVELAQVLLADTAQCEVSLSANSTCYLAIVNIKNEREQADEDIIMAVQKYTKTLQKSLEAAEMLKSFADDIAKEV